MTSLSTMENNIKEREVIKKIKVENECTYFMQALLEDMGMVAVSLGGKGSLTIFYDALMEKDVSLYIEEIRKFCAVEILSKRLYNI